MTVTYALQEDIEKVRKDAAKQILVLENDLNKARYAKINFVIGFCTDMIVQLFDPANS